ncbi:MAG TPA: nuclear transport factor 2 family protein [Candidatus Polarisedimenticolia bacterium]
MPTPLAIRTLALPVALAAALAALAAPDLAAASRAALSSKPAAPAHRAAKTSSDEATIAEIRDFETRFNKSYEANDLKAYFDFYTDDMTQFWQQGRLDLPDYRKLWEKEIGDGGKMLEVKVEEMVIHVGPSRDSAVAAYRIFTKMKQPDGTLAESWNQETDVLFKKNGRWKVVHIHYSDAPKTS